ncbi:MAG: hypothetical protein NUV31_08910 [Dehalococcoidales bacterium]|nr:hypothetical protein [Dehalococcoidales bacterium]
MAVQQENKGKEYNDIKDSLEDETMYRLLALVVIVLSLVCLAVGGIFLYQGFTKNQWLVENIKQEKITLGLSQEEIAAGKVLTTASELQKAGDTVRQHRHTIAPTYEDALGGKQFDPTDPKQLTYAQAMNLENYLYLGVLSFGVVQMALGAGAFMVVAAIALLIGGILLFRLAPGRN